MSSRGPSLLLLFVFGVLSLGILAQSPRLASWLLPVPASPFLAPGLFVLVGASAVYLAWDWHRSLESAKREGELAKQREFEQRIIAQQQLNERQQWHRSLFENNHLAMFLSEPETGKIVDVNPAALEFYGYSRSQFLALSTNDLAVSPPEVVRQRALDAASMTRNRFETEHRLSDGSLRTVSLIAGPILFEGRSLLFCIIQDISAQARAEETVRRIIEASPMGFHMYRLEHGKLIFANYNRAAEEILNTPHASFVGKSIDELFPAPGMQSVASCYREIAENGGRWTLENFTYVHGRFSGIFDVNAFQVAPGEVVAMFSDATERYRQEEMLARSERRFRLLYERSPVGIATIDVNNLQIISANRALQQILGCEEATLLQRRFDQLPSPESGDPLLVGPESFSLTQARTIQHRYLRRDGGFVWVEMTLCGIPGDERDAQLGLAIIQDITQRRRTDEQLRQAKQAAERASAAKDQFLAALSHELRTPLTPVLLTTQALQMDETLPEPVRDELSVIQRNVEMEARLIDDLLDLTRISRGKLQLHTTHVDLHQCIRHAVEVSRPDACKKQITLELWLDAKCSGVLADASRMQQVFWNLIKNAIKFTPQHGLVIVRTRNDHDADDAEGPPKLVCEVSDNGVGMDAETLSRIFLPFEQGSAQVTRLFGGLGLGLAISKAILDLHHGSIEAYSAGPGTGSSVTVTLQAATAEDLAPPPAPAPSPLPIHHPLTVLLVEDHEATARILSRLLVGSGYRVICGRDVATALQLAADNDFDLLISDLGLPDGTGLELLPRIRHLRQTPAIAVSGYGMEQDVRNSLAAGFQEHLIKPVNLDNLRQAISRVMGHAAQVI